MSTRRTVWSVSNLFARRKPRVCKGSPATMAARTVLSLPASARPGGTLSVMAETTRSLPSRVLIEGVAPEIDAGAYPIKRTVGEAVRVEADLFADGHDVLAAVVLFRQSGDQAW